MRKNKHRELIKHDKPTIGTHIHSTWPGTMEILGLAEVLDYVEFTSTYAPYDLYAIDNMARASNFLTLSTKYFIVIYD